ncbi:hypothetical protein H4219_005693 [Mycoemilia scoparia]|uniref:Uncharacterized protein n=1 Tax=Mycoemilia scoparia TaxID=417184 RepID=A0A9W7ZLW1_9FUNG|nr:hypothetical protein H4219_005693 [Mycoemilia scoparia]
MITGRSTFLFLAMSTQKNSANNTDVTKAKNSEHLQSSLSGSSSSSSNNNNSESMEGNSFYRNYIDTRPPLPLVSMLTNVSPPPSSSLSQSRLLGNNDNNNDDNGVGQSTFEPNHSGNSLSSKKLDFSYLDGYNAGYRDGYGDGYNLRSNSPLFPYIFQPKHRPTTINHAPVLKDGGNGRCNSPDTIERMYNQRWGENKPLADETDSMEDDDQLSHHSVKSLPLLFSSPNILGEQECTAGCYFSLPPSPTKAGPWIRRVQWEDLFEYIQTERQSFDEPDCIESTNSNTARDWAARANHETGFDCLGENWSPLRSELRRGENDNSSLKRQRSLPSCGVNDDIGSTLGYPLGSKIKRSRTI